MDELDDPCKKKVHKEGLEELTDEDFLRQMGIGCEDNGLQLTQISELTANIDSKQGALPRDSEINIESYYKFDSNNESSTSIVNYNSYGQDIQTKEMNYMQLYEQQSSTPPPNYNSYGQEQQMQQHNVITSPGETSYVLSQGGSS